MADEAVIKDAGDGQRTAIAITAIVDLVKADPRVQEVLWAWLDAHARDGHSETEREALSAVIRDELGLRYDWLPSHVLYAFGLDLGSLVLETPFAYRIDPPHIEGFARGRAPTRGGANIRAGVEWFYRSEIAEGRETVYGIAKQSGRSPGYVTGRIKLAKSLLLKVGTEPGAN